MSKKKTSAPALVPRSNFDSTRTVIPIGKQHRAVSKDDFKLDLATRTIRISFSSEAPVERWFGNEVLSHAPGACDLSRFEANAQALFNHEWDQYVGVIESASIDANRRGYCVVRFSKNAFADQVMKDVEDGIICGVSFGYQIFEMILSKEVADGPSEYLATKWQPFEVSFVTVPADISVGVGRARAESEKNVFEVPILNTRAMATQKQEKNKMPEIENVAPATPVPVNVSEIRAEAAKAERERSAAIAQLGEKFDKKDLARQLMESGASIETARSAFLEQLGIVQKPVTQRESEIGLSAREIGKFSFLKAIRAMMDPQNRKFQEEAGFEREVSQATQKQTARDAKGFLVPFDVLRAKRDLVVGTSTAGGDLVGTDLLTGSFIDLLRNKSILQAAGASVLSGLVGNIAIPRKTGAATVYWAAEGGSATEGAIAFDQVTMSPKTVTSYVDYSRRLTLQTSMDVENMVRADLALGTALEIDRVGLYGSGSSNQPLGLKNITGVQTSDFAADAPTWAEVVGLETLINAANADISVLKYITNAAGMGNYKTTAKASNQAIFIMENGKVNGYDALRSQQVASGDHFFGAWDQLYMAFWSGLDVLVDPFTGSTAGNIRVITHQDCDINARQPTAFARGNNTL